jgi:hypothetical protein
MTEQGRYQTRQQIRQIIALALFGRRVNKGRKHGKRAAQTLIGQQALALITSQ